MRRTREQAAVTRRTILQVAEELFGRHDYEKVSLHEIAVTAGVTPGAIQWHFQSKAGLMLALFNEISRPMHDLAEHLSAGLLDDPLEALAKTMERVFLNLQRNHRDRRILASYLSMMADNPETLVNEKDASHQQFYALLYEVFTAAEAKNLLQPPWTTDTAANTMYLTIDGVMKNWLFDEGTLNLLRVSDGVTLCRTILTSCRRTSDHLTGMA